METDKEKLRGKLILALGMTLFAIGQSLLFIVVAPFAQSIGMSVATFGIILGLSNLPLLIMSPYWGKKSDQIGRRPVFLIGLVGSGTGTLLVALALQGGMNGWYPIAFIGLAFGLTRAFYAATGSGIYPAASAYMADVTEPSKRAQGMALIGGANSLGSILGPLLGGGLAFMGLLFPMYIIGFITLGGAVMAYFLLKEPTRHVDSVSKVSTLKFTDSRLRPFLILWAAFFLCFIALNIVTAFYITERFGITDPAEVAATAGKALLTLAVVITVAQGLVFQVFKPSAALLVKIFGPIYAISFLIIGLAPTTLVMYAGYAILGLGFAFAIPGLNGGASLAVEPHEQGTAAGYLAAANTTGAILGPLIGPALFTIAPSVPMFAAAGLFGLLSIYALTIKIKEPH
jgi:MFS family permease